MAKHGNKCCNLLSQFLVDPSLCHIELYNIHVFELPPTTVGIWYNRARDATTSQRPAPLFCSTNGLKNVTQLFDLVMLQSRATGCVWSTSCRVRVEGDRFLFLFSSTGFDTRRHLYV